MATKHVKLKATTRFSHGYEPDHPDHPAVEVRQQLATGTHVYVQTQSLDIEPDEEFETDEDTAASLVDQGLAVRVTRGKAESADADE